MSRRRFALPVLLTLFTAATVQAQAHQELIDATAGGAFATGHHDFTYFSFSSGPVLALTDEEAALSTAWDIAFKRSELRLNSGSSGPGQVKGYDLHARQDVVPEDAFEAVGRADAPTNDQFVQDEPAYAVDQWWSYDAQTHTVSASGKAYQIQSATGKAGKFVVDTIEGAGFADAGRIGFRWVLGADLSGPAQRATVDVSGARTVYFSLDSGAELSPADPATSTEWDLCFSGYTIRLNSGISGPGQAGALLADQAFEEIAAPAPAGFTADKAASVFSTSEGEWYSYNPDTHALSPRNHVYLIDTGAGLFKMQLLGYYRDMNGTPTSGWITLRWSPLTGESTAVRTSTWGEIKDAFSPSR